MPFVVASRPKLSLKKTDLMWSCKMKFQRLPLEIMADYWERKRKALEPLNAFLREEGALAVLRSDQRGPGGTIFAEAASSADAKLGTFIFPMISTCPRKISPG